MRGTCDPVVPHEWAEEVVEMLPQGSLAKVPGAGHTLNYSAPVEPVHITRALLAPAS